MRYLLVFAIIALLAWRWRASLSRPARKADAAKSTSITMEQCRHCGVHIPADEVITGALGVYCSQGHRTQAES